MSEVTAVSVLNGKESVELELNLTKLVQRLCDNCRGLVANSLDRQRDSSGLTCELASL